MALIHRCCSTAAAQRRGDAFVLGGIGAAGWFWGVADYVMFYAAMASFAATLVFCTQALRSSMHGGGREACAVRTDETACASVRARGARDNTVRPETVTVGTNELIGTDPAPIERP